MSRQRQTDSVGACASEALAARRELIVGPERLAAEHRGRAAAHIDRQRDGLGHLLTGRAVLMGHPGVEGDTTIAVHGNTDGERHQLLCLRIN